MVIDLQQSIYSVAESDRSVEVCVILSSVLDRNISVILTTADITAQGQLKQLRAEQSIAHYVPARCHYLPKVAFQQAPLFLPTAPGDYMSSTVDVTFTPSSNTTMCVDIQVFQDGAVEDQEVFTAGLSSSDLAVNFTTTSTASIFISDNDCKRQSA